MRRKPRKGLWRSANDCAARGVQLKSARQVGRCGLTPIRAQNGQMLVKCWPNAGASWHVDTSHGMQTRSGSGRLRSAGH